MLKQDSVVLTSKPSYFKIKTSYFKLGTVMLVMLVMLVRLG